jgi:hypothetical protein
MPLVAERQLITNAAIHGKSATHSFQCTARAR